MRTIKLSERITMKDRINRIKQYVSSHRDNIVVGAGVVTLGVAIGSRLSYQHTYLTITPDELEKFLTDEVRSASYKTAWRKSVHLIKVPSH